MARIKRNKINNPYPFIPKTVEEVVDVYRNAIGAQKIQDRTFEIKHYFRNKIKDHQKLALKTPKSDSLSAGIKVVEVLGKDVQEVKNRLFDVYGIDSRPMS